LVADGLFTRDGVFHPLPQLPLKPLEEIFRARVIQLLVELNLLKADRVKLLYSWKRPGFNVQRGESVGPENKSLLTQLAQYLLRNPFSVGKMTILPPREQTETRSSPDARSDPMPDYENVYTD
jgi:hypothetical protein